MVQAVGDRAVIAHDAKALTEVPDNLVFDTAVAGYLLDPARRGYPLDELAEERGIGADAGDELATTPCSSTSSPSASARRSTSAACRSCWTRSSSRW